jgi:hypothetical protein
MIVDGGFIWLASYPKSGNTWLRCLLEAYRNNGHLNINDMRVAIGDSGQVLTQAVCPLPVNKITDAEVWLLRPAALLHAMALAKVPRFIKTHYANIQPPGLPAFIPAQFSQKGVYIVRDPRSVAVSFSRHFGFSIEKTVKMMNNPDTRLSGSERDDGHTTVWLGTWSGHAESWVNEKRFSVCLVKYEDMLERTDEMVKGIIEFIGLEYDEKLAKKAIRAASLRNLQKHEESTGFIEKSQHSPRFFTEGGTRWEEELGPKWIKQIEKDHGPMMKRWGYL